MNKFISDTQKVKYRVLNKEGKVLREAHSYQAAEAYVWTLDENEQTDITIVPVTDDGNTVLFG